MLIETHGHEGLLVALACSCHIFGRQEAVPWEHKEIQVMGRRVMQPRMVAYMADDISLKYTYSRTTLTPNTWMPSVAAVKATYPPSSTTERYGLHSV